MGILEYKPVHIYVIPKCKRSSNERFTLHSSFFIDRQLTLSLRLLKLRIDATRVWSENNTLKKLNTPVGILTKDQRSPNDSLKARPLARDRYHLISMTDINLLLTTDYLQLNCNFIFEPTKSIYRVMELLVLFLILVI